MGHKMTKTEIAEQRAAMLERGDLLVLNRAQANRLALNLGMAVQPHDDNGSLRSKLEYRLRVNVEIN